MCFCSLKIQFLELDFSNLIFEIQGVSLVVTNKFFTGIANGYPCFVVSIAMIGVCTAVIGDVAGHLGCFIFLKDSVNAIAFVALGTSVPGTDIVLSILIKYRLH